MNRLTPEERRARSHELGIIVDPEDEWLLSALTWQLSLKGYVECSMYVGDWHKRVKFHHFITGTPVYENLIPDHENRNKLDNRRSNLRWVTLDISVQNRDIVLNAANIRLTRRNKYEVRVRRNNVTHHIGTFTTEQEAVDARERWFATK